MSAGTSWSGRLRALAVLTFALTVPAVTGYAATGTSPGAAVTDVRLDGTTVTGVLTLRSTDVPVVDPTTFTVSVDGTTAPARIERATRIERRAVLVIDTSGSMGVQGMATVREAVATYLQDAPKDAQIGIASFADSAGLDLAPTTDRAAVQRVVDRLVSAGDTSLYAGVQSALKALGATGDRSIVLLSDGADTLAADKSQARAAVIAAVAKARVRVDVVRFRTNDPDAAEALQAIAAAGGGTVVAADNSAAVTAAFRSAARALESQVAFSATVAPPGPGGHTVEVKGVASGVPFRATSVLDLGAGPAAPASPTEAPTQAAAAPAPTAIVASEQSWIPLLAAGLCALALVGFVFVVSVPSLETRRERRVASIEQYLVNPARSGLEHTTNRPAALTEQLVGLGERAMKDRHGTSRTMLLIDRADLPLRAGEWFVLRGVSAVVGIALGVVLLEQSRIVGLVLGAVLGLALPPLALRFLASRRANAFERILPDVLTLVATSLNSGFGLPQALDSVARDAGEPAGKEFSRALAESRIGTDLADALDRVATRMNSTSMAWAVMALRIQRDVGGNLAETLRTTARTLRERETLRRQARTLSAEGRLSAYILIGLPLGLFAWMAMVNNDYISQLWTKPLGLVMLGFGAVSLVVGIFWMSRVVKIEV